MLIQWSETNDKTKKKSVSSGEHLKIFWLLTEDLGQSI